MFVFVCGMNSNELVYIVCMCAHGVCTPHDVIVCLSVIGLERLVCAHGDVMMQCYKYGFFDEKWHSALIVNRKNIEYE